METEIKGDLKNRRDQDAQRWMQQIQPKSGLLIATYFDLTSEGGQDIKIDTHAYSIRKDVDIKACIEKINQSKARKPISELRIAQKDFSPSTEPQSLKKYFDENSVNRLVALERQLLLLHGIDVEKDYYLVIPFPNSIYTQGFIFIIVSAEDKDEKEQEMLETLLKN